MCSCGAKYNLQHSLSCKKGGFVSLRHNHLRNVTSNLIDQVCHDVRVEPPLQILTGETFDNRSTNVRDEGRLNISARGYTKWDLSQKWGRYKNITRVFCKLKMEVSPHKLFQLMVG